ncbi:MAG: ABC-2 family transporter protein [Nanoarchaeota archaeon]|nr:ABC-2 family transporter protein [Nanoarchaeota archaeon]MEC8339870.1 ABC-2 family transporter protein [Nanoarchaeota archaeon]
MFKSSIIKDHLQFLKESFIISMKTSKEYKLNTYFMITFDIVLVLAKLLAFYIILELVGDVIQWTILDYFIWYVLILIYWKFYWMHNLRGFSRLLLDGGLNQYLFRPLSPYLQINSNKMSFANFVSGILLLLLIYFIAFYQEYSNYLFATGIMVLGFISFFLVRNTFEAFSFFGKNLNFVSNIYDEFDSVILRFTPRLFAETILRGVAFLFTGVYGYFFVELMKGNFLEFNTYFKYLFLLTILFLIVFTFMWKKGLEKYEAFG